MLESFILGAVQGIAEWLPVSSEGLIFIIKANFFAQGATTISDVISLALFLHFGTFLAALVYFRKQVWRLIKTLFQWKHSNSSDKATLKFLIISSAVTGVLGLGILQLFAKVNLDISIIARSLTLVVALLLIVTGILQLRSKRQGRRQASDIKNRDTLLLGVVQALAALPGLSRSGLTVSTLLLDRFDKEESLRLSFLMSLPVIFMGNIILNTNQFSLNWSAAIALLSAFVFGLATIRLMLHVAKKINFGYFILVFAALTLIAVALI